MSAHEKEDLFSQVHVNVAEEGFDLYDGLARYFDDVVEIGGQKKQMEVSIVDPPPLLQVQLQVIICASVTYSYKAHNVPSSGSNSTVRHSKHTSRKRTSSSARPSIWIVS